MPAPRALYLHGPGQADPVFGLFHAAPGTGHTAVVLVPPFGYDDVCAYRGLRAWALTLAAGGVPVLRIDLPGSGDSGGTPSDPGRAESWPAAVDAAGAWLRAQTGAARVVAIGLGLGGLVAAKAAADGAPIDDLVLWGTPARGSTLVRELRAFARLGVSRAEEFAWPPEIPPLPDGALESGGFLLSPDTVAWLQAVDLAATPLPDAGRRRILLLGREGIRVDARLERALTAAGAAVSVAEGPGYTELMDEPHRSLAPAATIAVVSAWLGEAPDVAAAAAPILVPSETDAVELPVDGATVRETPVAIAGPPFGGDLFGIVAEPADGGDEAAPLTVVFLDVGAERRIGANRMWVEAARRWASAGVPSIRLDLVGIGEGGGPTTPWDGEYALYDDALVAQVAHALDALPGLGLPPRFLLVGMCSGAYWAFTCARRDPRIVALDLHNTRMLLFDETRGSAAEVRHLRRLAQRELWRDLLAGKLTWDRARRMLRAIGVMAARLPALLARRLRARAAGGDPLDLALDGLRDQGTHVTLRFTAGEPLRDDLLRSGHLDRLARWPNMRLHDIVGPPETHTLQVVRMQPAVHEAMDAFLAAQRARLDDVADGRALTAGAASGAGA